MGTTSIKSYVAIVTYKNGTTYRYEPQDFIASDANDYTKEIIWATKNN